jgi:hypothetical protein
VRRIGRICVFCGSSAGADRYREVAQKLGALMALEGRTVIYGGGSVGLMGLVANAALEAGGQVTGVIPEDLARRELLHTGLTETHIVKSMHERKALMASLADAFVALPGGYGTFEELLEVVTWAQLGIHEKPVGLVNVDGFYDGLLQLVRHATSEGFIPTANAELIAVENTPEELLARLDTQTPATVRDWLDVERT